MLKQSYGWRQNPGKAKKQVNVTAKTDKSGIAPSWEEDVKNRREDEVTGTHINRGFAAAAATLVNAA